MTFAISRCMTQFLIHFLTQIQHGLDEVWPEFRHVVYHKLDRAGVEPTESMYSKPEVECVFPIGPVPRFRRRKLIRGILPPRLGYKPVGLEPTLRFRETSCPAAS